MQGTNFTKTVSLLTILHIAVAFNPFLPDLVMVLEINLYILHSFIQFKLYIFPSVSYPNFLQFSSFIQQAISQVPGQLSVKFYLLTDDQYFQFPLEIFHFFTTTCFTAKKYFLTIKKSNLINNWKLNLWFSTSFLNSHH